MSELELDLNIEKEELVDIELSDIEDLLSMIENGTESEFDYDILDDNDRWESDVEEDIKNKIEEMTKLGKSMEFKMNFIKGLIEKVKDIDEDKRLAEEERRKKEEERLAKMRDYYAKGGVFGQVGRKMLNDRMVSSESLKKYEGEAEKQSHDKTPVETDTHVQDMTNLNSKISQLSEQNSKIIGESNDNAIQESIDEGTETIFTDIDKQTSDLIKESEENLSDEERALYYLNTKKEKTKAYDELRSLNKVINKINNGKYIGSFDNNSIDKAIYEEQKSIAISFLDVHIESENDYDNKDNERIIFLENIKQEIENGSYEGSLEAKDLFDLKKEFELSTGNYFIRYDSRYGREYTQRLSLYLEEIKNNDPRYVYKKELSNFFNALEKKGNINQSFFENNIGEDYLLKLWDVIKNDETSSSIEIKNILSKNNLIEYLENISYAKKIKNKLPKAICRKDPDGLYEYFLYLDKEDKLTSEYLQKHIGDKFLEGLWNEIKGTRKSDLLQIKNLLSKDNLEDYFENLKTIKKEDTRLLKGIDNIKSKVESNPEYFLENKELISFIDNKQDLDQIINIFEEKGEKIDLFNINKNLIEKYVSELIQSDSITIGIRSIKNLETIVNITDKLLMALILKVQKQGNTDELAPLFIMKMKSLGKHENDIANLLDSIGINILFGGLTDYIYSECFNLNDPELIKIRKKYSNPENYSEADIYALKNDTENINFLKQIIIANAKDVQDIGSDTYNLYKLFIEYDFLSKQDDEAFFFIEYNDIEISKKLLKKSVIKENDLDLYNNKDNGNGYMDYIKSEHLKSDELLDCYINELKNPNNDIESLANYLLYFDLNNINTILKVIHGLDPEKNPKVYDIFQKKLKDKKTISIIMHSFNNSFDEGISINKNYQSDYNKLLGITYINDKNHSGNIEIEKKDNATINSEFISLLKNSLDKEGLKRMEKNSDFLKSFFSKNQKQQDKNILKIFTILKKYHRKDNGNNIKEITNQIWSLSLSFKENKLLKQQENLSKDAKSILEAFKQEIENKSDKEITEIFNRYKNEDINTIDSSEKAKLISTIKAYIEFNKSKNISSEDLTKHFNNLMNNQENEINQEETSTNSKNTETTNNSTENNILEAKGYKYNFESGEIIIPIKGKEDNPVQLSDDEIKLAEKDPKILNNIVNFYKFFADLNLLSVWEYRDELINSIGLREINDTDDSLTKEELRKFGNTLLTFIANIGKSDSDNKEKIDCKSLSEVNKRLREFSGADSFTNDEKTYNLKGEDKLAAYMRNFGIIGGAYFHTHKFREAIS